MESGETPGSNEPDDQRIVYCRSSPHDAGLSAGNRADSFASDRRQNSRVREGRLDMDQANARARLSSSIAGGERREI